MQPVDRVGAAGRGQRGACAQKGETVKIACIDPLSGLFAAVGQNQLKSFQFIAEHFNKQEPGRREVRDGGFDNKLLARRRA